MQQQAKQQAGFKFGVNPTKLIGVVGEVKHDGRTYRLCLVEADGHRYHALRLYNARGKFIKQLMTEPVLAGKIAGLYGTAFRRGGPRR